MVRLLKVGVIGVGSMGQQHVRIYSQNDDVQLIAVADTHTEQLGKVARRYNAVPYVNYREMLAKEQLDAVSIAVPTSFHKEVALAALGAGKHVLLEKPIASSEKEAEEIIAGAGSSKAKLMIGHIERFNPAVIELKHRLQRGELGEIYKIDVQRIGPFPLRITDVGVIVDLSVHDLDVIDYLIGVAPLRIYAETQQKLHPNYEDSLTALICYANETLAVINVNYLSPTKTRQIKVFGKKGLFLINYLDQELYFYENQGFIGDTWNSVREGEMKKINIQKKEPLQAEIEAFIRCLQDGTESPLTGEQGLQILKIAHLLHQSAQAQRVITVAEWEQKKEVVEKNEVKSEVNEAELRSEVFS